jgi:pilus assembly protein CpaC
MLRSSLIALLGSLLLLLPGSVLAQEDETIPDQVVVVNSQAAIDIPYTYGDVSGGSSEIIRVVPLRDSQQILVAGRKAGTTNIIVYDTSGVRRDTFEVTVIPANLSRVMKNVQQLLDDVEGLTFKVVNDRVYVQGEVSLDEDLQRVSNLADREPLVVSMVRLSPVSQRLLADLIQKEIGVPGVQVRLVSDKILLEGVVHSKTASERAEAIARAYYQNVINVLEIREAERIPGRTDTVVVIVHFVELTKSLVDSWGINWSPLATESGIEFFFQAPYDSASGWGDVTGYAQATLYGLLPRLNRARTSGYARVMENPSVAVKSADTATIFSGAKVPFAIVGPNGQITVQYEEVGITLEVTPFAQGSDVDISVSVEVSALGEVAPSGYQMIDTSKIVTSEYCRAGESIVIGGLQRLSDRIEYNRVPEGGSETGLPVFTLYKSKDYKKSKSQFLVFVTPQVYESSTQANRDLQDKFNLIEVRQ